MPKVDVFSAFKESDKLSQNIRQLQNNVKGLTTDINEYRQVANKAFDKRKEIKLDITKAKTELKELEKAYQNGDKTAEKSYRNKQKHLDLLNEEYRRLGTVIADSNKAEKKLADDISRNNNKNSSRDIKGTMKSLAKSNLAGMVVDSVSGFATQSISSAYGSSAGEAVGDIVGGAASGAAIGTAILPGVGTAIGGAIGALTGAINSLTKHLEKKDEIFREEVKSIQAKVKQEQEQNHQEGLDAFSILMGAYSVKETEVKDLRSEINSGYGEGFTTTRTPGLDYEINKIGGELGKEMKFAQSIDGKYDALLKNKESDIKIKAYENLFDNSTYKKLKQIIENPEKYSQTTVEGAIKQAHLLIEETAVEAETNWVTSTENQEDIQQEIELTKNIQKALSLSEDYINLLMNKEEVSSLGMLGAKKDKYYNERAEMKETGKSYYELHPEIGENYRESIYNSPFRKKVEIDLNIVNATKIWGHSPVESIIKDFGVKQDLLNVKGHATGLRRVPFDNMPAILHEGERVLTRIEADNLDRIKNKPPTNITLQVSANTSNPYQLAQILYSELKNAMENYGGA